MSLSSTTNNMADLDLCWRKWVDIVTLFARRRRGWTTVDPSEYQAMYQRLIEGCEAIDRSKPGPRGFDHRKAAEVIRPWLTPASLAKADRELLQDLVNRSGEIDGRTRGGSKAFWAVATRLIVVGAVASGLAMLVEKPKMPSLPRGLWLLIDLYYPELFVALIVAGSIYVIARPRRV